MANFTGFGPKALDFFKALKFHQSKEWFDQNRDLHQSDVVEPMIALLDDLTAAFAGNRVSLKADGKRSIFRVHRDVRFAKDKSPYKTHCGAVMTRSGSKNDNGLLYIHIDPEGCFVVAGFYAPASPDLLKIRQAIAGTAGSYKRVETALGKGGLSLSDSNQLTRVPRGFEELKGGKLDHAIRLKSFIVREDLSARAIKSADLVETISDFAARAMPLLRFGWKALD
jgi:uncharacterized protein (TIGR02453 family)